jgi:hypothetical protein
MTKGSRVSHPVYGLGTVIGIEDSVKLNDLRYISNLNVYVKFDQGGPQGFAVNASNDVKELVEQ